MSDPTSIQQGLTTAEVAESRKLHGNNILTPPVRDPWWKLFLEKFDDPIIRILLVAAVIAIGVGYIHGEYTEGVGIILAIFLATFLAFLNEYKANKEFDVLNQVSEDVPVNVIRNGEHTAVPRKDIVVGDVVLLELGEEIPADGTVVESVSLQVDESRLTGESVPANKYADPAKASKDGAYPANKVLRGCLIRDGHGIMIVDAVGDSTEIGKTIEAVHEDTGIQTPLNQQLERLSKLIGVLGFSVAALLFAVLSIRGIVDGQIQLNKIQGIFLLVILLSGAIILVKVWLPIVYDLLDFVRGERPRPAWLEAEGIDSWIRPTVIGLVIFLLGYALCVNMGNLPVSPSEWFPYEATNAFLLYFMLAVTIIVVAVPEGLGMSVTLSLAYSMRKMTASNNLVRRMHACETIGAATVICSDKTGTLTRNEMRVHETSFPQLGEFAPDANKARQFIIESFCANSTANLGHIDNNPLAVLGNPTEGALLLWSHDHSTHYETIRDAFKIQQQLPFSTERKFMATLGKSAVLNESVLLIKGAPEIILARCTTIIQPDGSLKEKTQEDVDRILAELKSWQQRGMRTLAFAYRPYQTQQDENLDAIAKDMQWQGFVVINDPVRDEVPQAIAMCRRAGIQVKIVTGDVEDTAKEIGHQIGLIDDGEETACISGPAFGALSDKDARRDIDKIKVIYRARPLDKQKLVKTLQANDQVVAVTGDGTNDGPALNQANVGLAMGKTGTAVAKEASDIILLDDSFASIVRAVMWGRSLYENIQRFILFQLTINVLALAIALIGPFIGVELPFTVVQMLWINLIMDTLAALALASEPPHWSVMNRKPRKPTDFILSPAMIKSILIVGGLQFIFFLGFLLYIQKDGITDYELTLFFTTFVMAQVWNLFNAKAFGQTDSVFKGFFNNQLFLIVLFGIVILQVVIVTWGDGFFRTVPLSFTDWAIIVAGTSIILWVGELYRMVKRKPTDVPIEGLPMK